MPNVAFEEVEYKAPDCAKWLKEQKLVRLDVNNVILSKAMHIKNQLGIVNDKYHPKGVGENDILIIATAKEHGAELVSDEEKQNNIPKEPTKRKIPAVCLMGDVAVKCKNFVEYIKSTGKVFG